MDAEIVATWHGPFRFEDFLLNLEVRDRFNRPGIYLHTEHPPGAAPRLSYVGKAEGNPTLSRRQLTHHLQTVAGTCIIPLEFLENCEKPWGIDWNNPEVVAVLLDPDHYLEIVKAGFRYVTSCRVFFWPHDDSLSLKVLERNLLFDLRPTSTRWGTLSPPSQKLTIRHQNAVWLTESIRTQIRSDVTFA